MPTTAQMLVSSAPYQLGAKLTSQPMNQLVQHFCPDSEQMAVHVATLNDSREKYAKLSPQTKFLQEILETISLKPLTVFLLDLGEQWVHLVVERLDESSEADNKRAKDVKYVVYYTDSSECQNTKEFEEGKEAYAYKEKIMRLLQETLQARFQFHVAFLGRHPLDDNKKSGYFALQFQRLLHDKGLKGLTWAHWRDLHQALKQSSALSLEDSVYPVLIQEQNQNEQLVSLNLANTQLSDTGLFTLIGKLIPNKSLARLNLAENDLTDKGVVGLAKLLKENEALRSLNLSTNPRITAKGIQALFDALVHNNALEHLDIKGIQLDEEAYHSLSLLLASHRKLAQVELDALPLPLQKQLQKNQRSSDDWSYFFNFTVECPVKAPLLPELVMEPVVVELPIQGELNVPQHKRMALESESLVNPPQEQIKLPVVAVSHVKSKYQEWVKRLVMSTLQCDEPSHELLDILVANPSRKLKYQLLNPLIEQEVDALSAIKTIADLQTWVFNLMSTYQQSFIFQKKSPLSRTVAPQKEVHELKFTLLDEELPNLLNKKELPSPED